MKLLLSFLLTFTLVLEASAQGIEFFHGTWNDALEESKKQGKPIFVDAYAKWCGPCKRMAATTFKDNSVGEYFNKNFINVKIDAEESEGVKFRQKYPVDAFPTLFFIDEKGELIHRAVGAQDVKGIIRLAEMALSKVDYSREYAAKYEKGNREPELVLNYVKALNKSNKSSLKISNEYLRDQKNLTTEENLRFILEAAVEADSRIFGLLIKYQKEIGKLAGLQAIRDRILLACTNTSKKAVEFQSPELLAEAKDKMKQHYPEKAEEFAAEVDLNYFKATNDPKNYISACDDYLKKVAKGDIQAMHRLAQEIATSFATDEKCMKQAEKYAKEAAKGTDSYDFYLTYASILFKNGKKKDAIEAANKSLQLAKQSGDASGEQNAQMFIRQIEG